MIRRLLSLAGFVVLTFTATTYGVEQSRQQMKQTAFVEQQTESAEVTGRRFQLSADEWTRYKEIMAGEGQYHWPHVDPVWVMSIYAASEMERRRYAKLAARQEYERTRKLLRFKDAYVDAFWQMYNHEPIMDLEAFQKRYLSREMSASVNMSGGTPGPIKRPEDYSGDRIVLFISTNNCPDCDSIFMNLSQHQTQVPGAVLDVHFVDDTRSSISDWAKRMGIAPSDITQGYITLNQDAKMYARYGNPSLPAAFYFDASQNAVQPIAEASR